MAENDAADESTGVPGFKSWRRLYWLVALAFTIYVLGLVFLQRVFA